MRREKFDKGELTRAARFVILEMDGWYNVATRDEVTVESFLKAFETMFKKRLTKK